jgi:hypothetical protein
MCALDSLLFHAWRLTWEQALLGSPCELFLRELRVVWYVRHWDLRRMIPSALVVAPMIVTVGVAVAMVITPVMIIVSPIIILGRVIGVRQIAITSCSLVVMCWFDDWR